MRPRRSSRIHYFKVLLGLADQTTQPLRVLARDPVEAIRIAEDVWRQGKKNPAVVHSSAVQQLDPLFEPLTTVN